MKRFKDFIEEATKPADKDSKGPFAIATKTRSGGLRRVADTRFDTYDSAHKYGMQYHTDRYGSQMFHVVHHPDAKKRMDEMAVRDTSGKLIQIRKQKFRGADMKLHTAYPGKSSSSGGGNGG
jgi:hypothetical protein